MGMKTSVISTLFQAAVVTGSLAASVYAALAPLLAK
jgi:hypothetical protein